MSSVSSISIFRPLPPAALPAPAVFTLSGHALWPPRNIGPKVDKNSAGDVFCLAAGQLRPSKIKHFHDTRAGMSSPSITYFPQIPRLFKERCPLFSPREGSRYGSETCSIRTQASTASTRVPANAVINRQANYATHLAA